MLRYCEMLTQRTLCSFAQIALLAILTAASAAGQDRPNFVFILSDDQGWSQVSFAMDPDVADAASSYLVTPNLARLAQRGMRFTSGYSPAPLCTPTRRSIFCGMTPARQRGTEFKSEFEWSGRLTLPVALKRADPSYRTAHFGKFGSDMGASPEEVGFDESDGWTRNRTGGMPTAMEERSRTVIKEDPKLVFSITDRAVGFIERQIGNHPFYVQISHYATHLQVQARQESLEKFESKGPPDRAVTHAFAAMLHDMDESIGRLLDALDRLGINDSKYVIFMADNGGRGTIPGASDSLSAPNRPLNGAKHTLYEGGVRVPFLVVGPGVGPNSVSDVPVTGYDLLPTLYDLAGGREPLPPEVDGGSFREVLENRGTGRVERGFGGLVFHRPLHPRGPASAIRLGNYKFLIKYASPRQSRARELFDLSSDLGERNDLSAKMPEKAAELERLLFEYLRSVGAETPAQ